MKQFSSLLLFCVTASCATATWAQEPPHVYKDFGFTPKGYANALTAKQKADLDACQNSAKEQVDRAKASNQTATSGDLYGYTLSDCLADEENGKGWIVREKTAEGWKVVPMRRVTRKFIGLPD